MPHRAAVKAAAFRLSATGLRRLRTACMMPPKAGVGSTDFKEIS